MHVGRVDVERGREAQGRAVARLAVLHGREPDRRSARAARAAAPGNRACAGATAAPRSRTRRGIAAEGGVVRAQRRAREGRRLGRLGEQRVELADHQIHDDARRHPPLGEPRLERRDLAVDVLRQRRVAGQRLRAPLGRIDGLGQRGVGELDLPAPHLADAPALEAADAQPFQQLEPLEREVVGEARVVAGERGAVDALELRQPGVAPSLARGDARQRVVRQRVVAGARRAQQSDEVGALLEAVGDERVGERQRAGVGAGRGGARRGHGPRSRRLRTAGQSQNQRGDEPGAASEHRSSAIHRGRAILAADRALPSRPLPPPFRLERPVKSFTARLLCAGIE